MIDLEAIEARANRYAPPKDHAPGCVCSFCRYNPDALALIAEVRKLRAQLYDAGLPDANDFPEVPNRWGGL